MKKNVIRLLMSLVAILTANTMLAENKLWIEQQSDGVMAVMMENDPTAAGLQFEVVLPAEVAIEATEIDGSDQLIYRNPERLNKNQIFKCAKSNNFANAYKVMIVSMDQKPFVGTSGPVAFFKVRSQVETPVELRLENMEMSTGTGDVLAMSATSWKGSFVLSSVFVEIYAPESFVVLPGQTVNLPINLRNSEGLAGFQFDIMLPAGFVMSDDFQLTSRLSNSTTVKMTVNEKDNVYRIVAVDVLTNKSVREEGEGPILYAPISVPATIAEGATIIIGDVWASTWGNASIKGVGCSFPVVDGNVALSNANAKVDALQSALDAALAEIAKDCPDVKDNFKGEDIQTAINDLKAAVNSAFENGTLTGNYDNVMAPAATIEANITKLVEDAKAAQANEAARVAANKKAYEATLAEIAVLQAHYDETVAAIKKDYADYEDKNAEATVQGMIDAASKAAADALAEVESAGEYKYAVDKAGITDAINALLQGAKDAKKKAEDDAEAARKELNKESYEADLAALEELYASYRATVAKIQAEYAAFENVSDELKVRNNLDNAKAEVEKAYKAVAKEGTYSYDLDVVGLQASIDKLLEDAIAAQKAANDEELRQNENLTAYKAVIAAIDALQKEFDDTVAAIKKDYAQYEDKDAEAAVQATINALRATADEALKAVEKAGKFEYTVDAAPVSAEIAKLLADAKARAEAATAEAERVAKNQQAYDAVMDEINAVKAERNEAATKIAEEYDLYDPTAELAAIDAALAAAEKAAADALEAVKDAGEFGYTFDAAAVRAMIQEMLANAEKVGAVEGIEAEVQSGNLIIFTLDGKRHANPVHGEVNIFVRKNGKTSKVMVD